MTNSDVGDEPRLNVDFLCSIIYFLYLFCACFLSHSRISHLASRISLSSFFARFGEQRCFDTQLSHNLSFDSFWSKHAEITDSTNIPPGPKKKKKKEEAYLKLPCSKVDRLTRCVTIIHFVLFIDLCVSTWEHMGSLDCFLFALCYVCLSASFLFAFTFTNRYLLSPVLGGSLLIACYTFAKLSA